MRFLLEIACDNAAFRHEDMGAEDSIPFATVEVARMLAELTPRLQQGTAGGYLFDANGNKVGSFGFEITPKEEAEDGA